MGASVFICGGQSKTAAIDNMTTVMIQSVFSKRALQTAGLSLAMRGFLHLLDAFAANGFALPINQMLCAFAENTAVFELFQYNGIAIGKKLNMVFG